MFEHMQKVVAKPLTYIEVEQNEPLNIKLDDKHMYTCKLQIAQNFIIFNSNKNIIMERLDRLNELKSTDNKVIIAKVLCYKMLNQLLFQISKPKGIINTIKWYRYLHKLFINDIDLMISVFKKVLEYNSDLKKKALNLQSFEIFQNNASDMTAGGVPLKDLIIVDPITGAKSFKH